MEEAVGGRPLYYLGLVSRVSKGFLLSEPDEKSFMAALPPSPWVLSQNFSSPCSVVSLRYPEERTPRKRLIF